MSGNTDLDKVLGLLESWRDEMVQVQVELVKRPALGPDNGGAGEWERARYLEQLVRGWGLSVEHIDAPDERVSEGTRPNLVVRLAGERTSPVVWVMAHMDVVPAGPESEWETPPFEAVVKDGKIFGRGVEDNQQGLVSSLFALRALKEANVTPPTDVALLLVSDEETGNRYGIEYVLEKRPDLVGPGDIVVVPDSGNPDGTMLEVAEKTILWVRFVVEGKQVHASMPQLGLNAHRVSARLVCRLDDELKKRFADADPVFDPPSSTFEPTKREANVENVNTIPGKEVLYFDCRILPNVAVADVMDTMKSVADELSRQTGASIECEQHTLIEAAPPTPTDAPVTRMLSKAVKEILGVEPKPMGIGGGTVAAVFRKKGIGAVVWSTLDDLAHQPNEYCVIDNMVGDAKVFAHLFLQPRLD